MQSVELTFYERIILWNMVGSQSAGNLKEAVILYGVLQRIRPTDTEMLDTEYVANQSGSSWKLPSRGYGDITLELDGEQAPLLARMLEMPQPVRVNDAPWLQWLVERLKSKADALVTSGGGSSASRHVDTLFAPGEESTRT